MGIGAEDAVTDAAVSQLKGAGLNSIQEPGNWSRVLLFNSAYGDPYTKPEFRKAVTLFAADVSGLFAGGEKATLITISGHRAGFATVCPCVSW
mgnify:CR=1 FL=1